MVSTWMVMASTRRTTTRTPGLRHSGAKALTFWRGVIAIGRIRKTCIAVVWSGRTSPFPLSAACISDSGQGGQKRGSSRWHSHLLGRHIDGRLSRWLATAAYGMQVDA